MPDEEIMFYDNENCEYITRKSLIKEMRAEKRRQLFFRRMLKKILIAVGLIAMPIAGWLIFKEPEVMICEMCAIPIGILYVFEK